MVRARGLPGLILVAVTAAACGGTHVAARPPRTSVPRASVPPLSVSVGARNGIAVELTSEAPAGVPDDPTAAARVSTAEQDFALRLLTRRLAMTGSGNSTVSPFSLAVALAMLGRGAEGPTLAQITRTLGTQTMSSSARESGWGTLLVKLAAQARVDGITLRSADALWLQHGLVMNDSFMADMARYFRTGVWQVDFASDLAGATNAINNWVATNTDGKITKLFNPGDIDPTTLLVLANAVYFHATWQDQFDPNNSDPGTFDSPSGNTIVTFMQQLSEAASVTGGYDEVRLPYSGGDYQAVAIMPKGRTLQDFVVALTPAGLDQILAAPQERADIQVPKFSDEGYMNLNQTLSAMGMPLAFTAAADFSAMSPTGLQVQSVVQRYYLRVAEKGTEAAAVTGISAMPSSAIAGPAPPVVKFDHPFLFLIRNVTTGVILFASLINKPE